MKRLFLFALAMLLPGAARLAAEELKPLAVASIASYDQIVHDLHLIDQMIGAPFLSPGLETGIAIATQGQELKGLDKTKPLGAALFLDSTVREPKALFFMGVTDAKALMASLPILNAQARDGVWQIPSPQGLITISSEGGWVFASNDPQLVEIGPSKVLKMLNGLEKKYSVALQINVQNIPKELRDGFMSALGRNANAAIRQRPDETPSVMQQILLDGVLRALEIGSEQIDNLTVGLALDAQARTTHLELGLTAIPGSKLAERIAAQSDRTSDFSGFLLPEASENLHVLGQFSRAGIERSLAVLKDGRAKILALAENNSDFGDERGRQTAKNALNDLFDIAENTVKDRKIDFGTAFMFAPNSFSGVLGGAVADGPALEKDIKAIVNLVERDRNAQPIKFDIEVYKGVRFHSMTLPISEAEGKRMFGDNLDIYMGFGEKSAYLAFGKGSLDLVKSLLDKQTASAAARPLPPLQLNVALAPIMRFSDSIYPAATTRGWAALLASSHGKDHLRLTAHTNENKALFQLEIEDGLWKRAVIKPGNSTP